MGVAASGVLDLTRSTVPMLYLFSALAGGNVSLITIVISINQLVLSRELRSPRELQMEIHAAEEYREKVERETQRSVVPEEPADFLRILLVNIGQQIETFNSLIDEREYSELKTDLDELASNIDAELSETMRLLEGSHSGVFPVLSTMLNANFVTQINQSCSLRQTHEDSLSDAEHEFLEEIEQQLKQLDIARQYFKTIFIERELADISKLVMYSGLVALVVALVFLLVIGYTTRGISPQERLVLVPLAIVINLLPLVLLVTHMLRIATVARRTVAITPFIASTE